MPRFSPTLPKARKFWGRLPIRNVKTDFRRMTIFLLYLNELPRRRTPRNDDRELRFWNEFNGANNTPHKTQGVERRTWRK